MTDPMQADTTSTKLDDVELDAAVGGAGLEPCLKTLRPNDGSLSPCFKTERLVVPCFKTAQTP